ncbi:MAG: hisH [Cyanobacteria bacterium RYN_339]|nr:hisH [Cyanobacteria bacterium RYN_339]
MGTVAIVDYGMGNVDSVARAIERCGGDPVITHDPADFARASHIVLPGVGSFGLGMRNLRERGLDAVLREQVVDQRVPFLGICLGMQLLATRGLEGGETSGLGWVEGEVVRLSPSDAALRVPHVGWNEVRHDGLAPFEDLPSGKDFYFVHSYHFACLHAADVAATTSYGGDVVAAVRHRNILGVQFHPEKSQKVGFQLLRNFLALGVT